MNNSFLFYSPPGATDFKYFRENKQGTSEFHFVSFRGLLRLDVTMQEATLPLNPVFYFRPETELPLEIESADYVNLVRKAIAEMNTQKTSKIVTSRAAVHQHPGNTIELFYQVQKAYPKAAVYLFSHPACGTWLGATPETLLQKSGNKIETMSLAGTREKSATGNFTTKEELEQQLVTDYIADLFYKEVGLSQTKVEPAEEVNAGNLIHYQSKIRAEITDEFDLGSFINKLHPTPAVGGLPVEKAIDFIIQNENYNRTFYSGYFGLKNRGDFHFFVNLRCMQIFEKKLALYAGGGITKDSKPMDEYLETKAKMETLLTVVNQISQEAASNKT